MLFVIIHTFGEMDKCLFYNRCSRKKEFQIIVYRGNDFGRWGFDFVFSTNGNNLCHSAWMTFPGNIKGCVMNSQPLFLIHLAAEQNINMKRAHSTMAIVPLGDHSFIIYSFFLDQLDIETSGWILNSCFNISNCFLPFVRITVQGNLAGCH